LAEQPDGEAVPGEVAAEAAPKSGGRKLLLGGGGIVAVLGLALALALMGVPVKQPEVPRLEGPFVTGLSKSDIQVNLSGEGSKRYLVMRLNAEYYAYDEAYVAGRLAGGDGTEAAASEDPLYTATLQDAMLRLAATKTRDQVTDPVMIDAFLEELREAVDPVLFPVCIGDSKSQRQRDSVSGLRTGDSTLESSLRGLLHESALLVDAAAKTISLDGGPPVRFEGTERDLRVVSKDGASAYVDVTGIVPEFSGEVPIGVPGRVRGIYRESFLVQRESARTPPSPAGRGPPDRWPRASRRASASGVGSPPSRTPSAQRRAGARSRRRRGREPAHSRSSTSRVLSLRSSPVLSVVFGSNSSTCVSSRAIGRCSTPRGTIASSPGPSSSSPSRKRSVNRPATTRKSSSSCS
jgi:hypothetical protein